MVALRAEPPIKVMIAAGFLMRHQQRVKGGVSYTPEQIEAWIERLNTKGLMLLMSPTTVAAVREKMVRPPELVKFERFKETWEELDDNYRAEFVKTFVADIRELMP